MGGPRAIDQQVPTDRCQEWAPTIPVIDPITAIVRRDSRDRSRLVASEESSLLMIRRNAGHEMH